MALGKANAVVLAVVALLVLAAAFEAPLLRSYVTTWSGPGCTSRTAVSINVNACGCTDAQLFGGYEFDYRGEAVMLFDKPGCTGAAGQTLAAAASGCAAFGWRSAYIHCDGH